MTRTGTDIDPLQFGFGAPPPGPRVRLVAGDTSLRMPDGSADRAATCNALEGFWWRSAPTPDGWGLIAWRGVLRHVGNPRELLREVWRRLHPEGRVWLIEPSVAMPADSLLTMAKSCHFLPELVKEVTHDGEALVAVDLKRSPAPRPTDVPHSYLASIDVKRAGVARAIVDASSTAPVGVWGYGSDLAAMAKAVPPLQRLLDERRIAVFDSVLAGRVVEGIEVGAPEAMATFPGLVFLTPSTGRIREEMLSLALRDGFLSDRIIDAYGAP